MKHLILVLGLMLSFGGNQAGSCKYARSELKALSCVIYYEARGATKIDKIATAFVALNRVDHPDFSDNLTGLCIKDISLHGQETPTVI